MHELDDGAFLDKRIYIYDYKCFILIIEPGMILRKRAFGGEGGGGAAGTGLQRRRSMVRRLGLVLLCADGWCFSAKRLRQMGCVWRRCVVSHP